MPPVSEEEQFKFLISCIRHSDNGRVQFAEVANECGIVSKGAAAKRYERMMKAHGITPNTLPSKSSGQSPVKGPGQSPVKGESSKGTSTRKRKRTTVSHDDNNNDEVLGVGTINGLNTIKKGNLPELSSNSDDSLLESANSKVKCKTPTTDSLSGGAPEHTEASPAETEGDAIHESIAIG